MRIGILTGGGDCPGLNAVIRAIVRKGIDEYGHAIIGFRDGWRGVLDNESLGETADAIPDTTARFAAGHIAPLAAEIDAKDPYTAGHSERVSRYASSIARQTLSGVAGISRLVIPNGVSASRSRSTSPTSLCSCSATRRAGSPARPW